MASIVRSATKIRDLFQQAKVNGAQRNSIYSQKSKMSLEDDDYKQKVTGCFMLDSITPLSRRYSSVVHQEIGDEQEEETKKYSEIHQHNDPKNAPKRLFCDTYSLKLSKRDMMIQNSRKFHPTSPLCGFKVARIGKFW